jgi:hypothetical protein
MLTGLLLDGLGKLKHSNGAPLIRIYGPVTTLARGGTVAFNVLDPAGHIVGERAVGRDANAAGISLHGVFLQSGGRRVGVRAEQTGCTRTVVERAIGGFRHHRPARSAQRCRRRAGLIFL